MGRCDKCWVYRDLGYCPWCHRIDAVTYELPEDRRHGDSMGALLNPEDDPSDEDGAYAL